MGTKTFQAGFPVCLQLPVQWLTGPAGFSDAVLLPQHHLGQLEISVVI